MTVTLKHLSPRLRKLIKAADAARDRRDWPTAAKFYGQIVEANPTAFGIAVQLGHALKEMGDYDKAEERYRLALAQTPDDDDLYLQIGHLEKLRQNLPSAMQYYWRALELNVKNLDARREYEALGGSFRMAEGFEQTGSIGVWNVGAGQLRSIGDRARDERRWLEAAHAYQDYLRTAPNDIAIWAQLGHSLKESGDLAGGEAAYRAGLSRDPDDADLHLHLGHVLKLQKRLQEAVGAYRRSFEISGEKAPYDELIELNADIPEAAYKRAPNDESANLIYFEIDDLLTYVRHNRTLSGIQRVQVGIIQYVLGQLSSYPEGYAFVFGSANSDRFWRVDPNKLRAFVEYLVGDELVRQRQIDLVSDIEQHAVLAEPRSGQCYFVLGAFWAFSGNARHARLKRAGVVTGAYVYDLIPITHPEFCDSRLVNDFTLAIGDSFAVFDFLLTISEFTAKEVRRFLEKHDLRRVPVKAVPLSHVLQGKASAMAPWTGAIAPLQHRSFVLCVSTIEPRKNHAYLVTIWKLLLEEGLDLPDLVFVGRYGWHMVDFKHALEATHYLDGRVRLLHDLTDTQLERLYQSCLFAAFPSFVEGWGLPVGECLAHGRPCVASSTTSIPEVGGDLVDYVDPYNVRAGLEVFRRMIFDEDYRLGREKGIREHFAPRTWQTVGKDLVNSIAQLRQVEVDRQVAPLLLPGELFRPSELRLEHKAPVNYPSRPLRPIMAEGWDGANEQGSWMRGTEGLLRFRTRFDAGTPIIVYIRLVGAKWCAGETISVTIGERNVDPEAHNLPAGVRDCSSTSETDSFPVKARLKRGDLPVRAGRSFICHAEGVVANDREVEVRLKLQGVLQDSSSKRRRYWVRLATMAYAGIADLELRTAILENLAL